MSWEGETRTNSHPFFPFRKVDGGWERPLRFHDGCVVTIFYPDAIWPSEDYDDHMAIDRIHREAHAAHDASHT